MILGVSEWLSGKLGWKTSLMCEPLMDSTSSKSAIVQNTFKIIPKTQAKIKKLDGGI